MELQILWEPEEGKCACCGANVPKVRSFTHHGRHDRLCFGCWSSMDPELITLSSEWDAAECVTFFIGSGEPDPNSVN